MKAGALIREARKRAGLTQSELAHRLRTSQPLVARWESGSVDPLFETVLRAIRACGLDLSIGLAVYDSARDGLIDDRLALSPTQRSRSMVAHIAAVQGLKSRTRPS